MASKHSYDAKNVSSGNPSIYLLNTRETLTKSGKNIRRCEIGPKVSHASEKVIMVVGATGAGKTSLVNSLVNYVLGVEWECDFRYQLVADSEEVKKKSQALSQTEWITAYTFYPQGGYKLPYKLTIIDTPGFGDTRGIKRDKEITEQIRELFTLPEVYGIDHLDAEAFVAQSSLARLTAIQKFVFDSVLSLFGKDIEENIFLFFTFADQQTPQILDSVKAAQLPHRQYFKFKNSALYAQKIGKTRKNDEDSSSDDDGDDEEGFNVMFWKMGKTSFKKFFKELNNTKSKSITLTADVLDERKRLETYIAGIPALIRSSLVKLERLKKEQQILEQHKADMNSNKNFEYSVCEEKIVKENRNQYAMVCPRCEVTCHFPCSSWTPNVTCSAMKFIAVVRGCGVCPGGCSPNCHKKVQYVYNRVTVEKKMTYEDLKRRYVNAKQQTIKGEELVERVRGDKTEAEQAVQHYIDGARKSLNRLKEIALKKNPLTTPEYIDVLIQNEKSEGGSGWKERCDELIRIRKAAELTEKIATSGSSINYKDLSN